MRIDVKSIAINFIGFIIRGVILVFAVMSIYQAGQKAYDFGFRIFTEEPVSSQPGRDVSITIAQGDSLMDVAQMFEEKGLIRDAYLFYVQKKCSVYDGDIKPGFYTLNTSMTAEDMFAIIAGKEGEEDDESTDASDGDNASEAAPLTEAAPLVEQTGDGEWEGSEEQEADLMDMMDADQDAQ